MSIEVQFIEAASYPSYSGETPAEIFKGKAACVGAEVSIFYPPEIDEEGLTGKSADLMAAKSICNACPVQPDCLEIALARREKHGVWGGQSERERKNTIRRRRNARIRNAQQ